MRGGLTGGTSLAIFDAKTNIEVIACINHDENAIISHKKNFPQCLHFTEDIRTVEFHPIIKKINELRKADPTCKIAIWASLECTNFSIAKCGPKNADSRTLANDLFRYMIAFEPDFLWIENVKEFLEWEPLDENNNPIKELKGVEFQHWKNKMIDYFFPEGGYRQELMTAADYGGRTIRKRLFLQFSKDKKEIGIPVKTHDEKGENGLPKWLAFAPLIQIDDLGKSIFKRKKDLVYKTHKKILLGLKKFPLESFGYKYYGQGGYQDTGEPCATLTTKDRVYLTHPVFIKENYGNSTVKALSKPIGTLTTHPKQDIVSIAYNPQYGGSMRSVDKPCATIIARQDKAPMKIMNLTKNNYERVLVENADFNKPHIETIGKTIYYNIKATDDEYMREIKRFMYENKISDILVRPLNIQELLQVQGFPIDYKLSGTQTEQKKYIGNSVEKHTGVALIKSIDKSIQINNIYEEQRLEERYYSTQYSS